MKKPKARPVHTTIGHSDSVLLPVTLLVGTKEYLRKKHPLTKMFPDLAERERYLDDKAGSTIRCGGKYYITIIEYPYDGNYSRDRWTIEWYAALVHEISHFVDHVFEEQEIPPGIESTEVRALVNDRLLGLAMDKVRKADKESVSHGRPT